MSVYTDPMLNYKANYKLAIKRSLDLLSYCNINSFPVSPEHIITHLGWDSKKYSFFSKSFNCSISNVSETFKTSDACTNKIRGLPMILYNDSISNTKQRIRFNIAHEIGHNVLGHNAPNVKWALAYGDNGQPNKTLYEELEKETNCFARNLLCPVSIIGNIRDTISISTLSSIFDISKDAARKRNIFLRYDAYYFYCLKDFSFLYDSTPFIRENFSSFEKSSYLKRVISQYEDDELDYLAKKHHIYDDKDDGDYWVDFNYA